MGKRTLHIQRHGGPLPTLRPEVSRDLATLPAQTRKALAEMLEAPVQNESVARKSRIPDAYSYTISLQEDGKVVASTTLPESAIPDQIEALLP